MVGERRFCFLDKSNEAKSFLDSAIWDFGFYGFVRVRFCGIVESGVDSAELQNRWLIKVGSEKGFYFLQKQKVAKTFFRFYALRRI